MKVIDILKVILFGIIEGVTEWLPISSTGHLILLEKYLDVSSIFNGGKEFFDLFLVVIQLGAILAVCCCYFDKLNFFTKNKSIQKASLRIWVKVLIACIPASLVGLFFQDELDKLYNFINYFLKVTNYILPN